VILNYVIVSRFIYMSQPFIFCMELARHDALQTLHLYEVSPDHIDQNRRFYA